MSNDATPEAGKDREDTSSSSEDESGDDAPVESLVAGRNKRATAGNRLSSLLEKEGDDELELLFAEDEEEEDVEFEGDDADDAEDVQLDSSSDDDDQGPTNAGDDFEGEKELQKQDRVERRKKRKAQEIFKRPQPLQKKTKIDLTVASTIPTTPVARPKKKSERLSWIPTPEEGPTRSSSRKQTVQNKEVVHQRMQESEQRRRQQIQVMEAAAKRKEASKPKVMTQADRMVEAARTEKRNAKSLNRWEETERKRSEEQKARLAALHHRQLQGPVITWWSGISKWANGKLVQACITKDAHTESTGGKSLERSEESKKHRISSSLSKKDSRDTSDQDVVMSEDGQIQQRPAPSPQASLPATPQDPSSKILFAPQGQSSFLDGIHYYASLPQQQQQHSTLATSAPPPQPVVLYATRNLVILENIDANAIRTPDLQNHVLMKKRNGKLQSESGLDFSSRSR